MYDVYENPVSVESNPGTATREEFKLSVGKDGRKCLTKIRDIDISAYINSYAPGCDMAVILDKLQAGLISTDFDEKNCVDLSLIPKDVVDAMQKNLKKQVQTVFNLQHVQFHKFMIKVKNIHFWFMLKN